jgi:Cu2+-exporting ATPase/Cu+-exporting ATPase
MNPRAAQEASPTGEGGAFAYLDRDEFREHYGHPENRDRLLFHIEGIHCTACLWRIEGVREDVAGVASARLDMGRHLLDVEMAPGGRVADVATRLEAMGYRPRAVSFRSLDDRDLTRKRLLMRLGVAAASAGNIMLLSTSLYSGADRSSVATAFEWLTFVLFLPILLYCAVPFYRASLAALRARRASIDVPIAAAVVIGTGLGLYHLVAGRGDIYFDSLAVLVFLLLGSRFLLTSLQQKYLSPGHLSAFYEGNRVRVRNPETGAIEERHIERVGWDDEVVVRRGERVPVDGRVAGGEVWVNAAVLTGEPYPVRLLDGQEVFAGTTLTSEEAVVRVRHTGADTRVGRLLEETERGVLSRTPLVSLTDRAAQWFSASVLALGALFAVIYATVDVHEAINRALALVILACPCALALATPLTQSLALKKAARGGALIKKAEAFEKLQQVRDVFFDKTGTLTRGELELEGWYPSPPDAAERGVIVALEAGTQHPVGLVLAADAAKRPYRAVELDDRVEVPGRGVSGRRRGVRWELLGVGVGAALEAVGAPADGATSVGLYRNGRLLRVARLADTIRPGSDAAVAAFEAAGRRVHLLTGDSALPAEAVAQVVGIPADRVTAAATPERKRDIIAGHPRALMVGDGVNDAVALAGAHVGVAVQGSMETSFRAADIYLTRPGLRPLADLFALSRATITIIKRNLLFSLVYNAAGAALALAGIITPLLAAVLMPLSSITVIVSSVVGTGEWRRFATRGTPPAGAPDATVAPPLYAPREGRA